jgi:hypothetical protein
MKMWVIPKSEISHSNFADAELRILNDRGFRFRDSYQPTHVCGNQNPPNTTVAAASRTVSCPYPNRPFVKLPAQDRKSDQPPYMEDSEPQESPLVRVSQFDPLRQTRKELPGKKWTEKWKEANGIRETTTDELTGENEKKTPLSFPIENETEPRSVSHHKSPESKESSAKGQMQYKINIPSPSLKQIHMFRPISSRSGNIQHQSRNTHLGGPTIKNVYQGHPSTFSQTSISQSHRCYGKASIHSTPKIVASIPRTFSKENARETEKAIDVDCINPSKSTVEIVCESLTPENHASSQTAQDISIPHISNPPSFPFPQTTDSDIFPFHPILNQRPTIEINKNVKSHSSDKTKVASQVLIDDSPATQISLMKSTVCYEWNYFLTCSTTENGECQKVHVCEICGSSEHRATQHWHHLATAPLPEIQKQPKLSTFAPPPESPTLSALKQHTSRFMNRSIDLTSQHGITSASRLPQISLFISPLGLEGSQRIAAQAERLKLRKRLARPKLTQSTDNTIAQIDNTKVSNNGISPALPTPEIAVAEQTSSPFEKPVEVILPPPLRPFQRKATPTDAMTAPDDHLPISTSPGGLRVTAPAFEPSYAGAWVPIEGTSNQFSGLFKIPSKESRRIQIVAPVDKSKGKGVVEQPNEESDEARSESRYSVKTGRSKGKARRSMDKKLGSVKTELWPAFSVFPGNADPCDDDLPRTQTEWYMPDFSQPCTSEGLERCSHTVCSISSPSKKFDSSVLRILDEQLDAIMGKESEETIATTLETIIEICSTSSVGTTPRQTQCESFCGTDSFDFRNSLSNPSQDDLQKPTSPSQLASLTTNQFSKDSTEDDVVFGSTSPREKSYQLEDYIRPRSADSSSTVPLTPFGSPHTSKILDLDHPRPAPLDHTPLKGRVEQMMSCAAARGVGQCNCSLGD